MADLMNFAPHLIEADFADFKFCLIVVFAGFEDVFCEDTHAMENVPELR